VGAEEIGARGDGVNRRREVPGGRVVHRIVPRARGLKGLGQAAAHSGERVAHADDGGKRGGELLADGVFGGQKGSLGGVEVHGHDAGHPQQLVPGPRLVPETLTREAPGGGEVRVRRVEEIPERNRRHYAPAAKISRSSRAD
jgi:hypothetical protein